MKFLENWSNWDPNPEEVKKWEDYLDKEWSNKIHDTPFGRRIQIDDKSYTLTNKGEVTNRLYWEIIYSENLSEEEVKPSLRRAIKNFIDKIK
jgi:hypothetical protein